MHLQVGYPTGRRRIEMTGLVGCGVCVTTGVGIVWASWQWLGLVFGLVGVAWGSWRAGTVEVGRVGCGAVECGEERDDG